MFYLYCSGYRPQYANTIFKTLCYPNGMINRHYYRCAGKNNHVSPVANQTLKNMDSDGQEAIIVIVDRNNNGYRYYPVRKAILQGHKYSNDSVYIYVKLGDFIFPKNVEQSEKELVAYCPDLPKLNADVNCTSDGAYVTVGNSIINMGDGPDNFLFESKNGIEVWNMIVEHVGKITTLNYEQDRKKYTPFFMRYEIKDENGKCLEVKQDMFDSYYSISEKKKYIFSIYGNIISNEKKAGSKVKLQLKWNGDTNSQYLLDYSIQGGEVQYELDFFGKEENCKLVTMPPAAAQMTMKVAVPYFPAG